MLWESIPILTVNNLVHHKSFQKFQSYQKYFKGIGFILFIKNGLKKKIAEKNYKNRLRRNDYEVCTAVARCFPNILDI
jgi:hypothetical protein